jgi:hypothetical protein
MIDTIEQQFVDNRMKFNADVAAFNSQRDEAMRTMSESITMNATEPQVRAWVATIGEYIHSVSRRLHLSVGRSSSWDPSLMGSSSGRVLTRSLFISMMCC